MKYELMTTGCKMNYTFFPCLYKQCMSQKYKQKEIALLCLQDIKL